MSTFIPLDDLLREAAGRQPCPDCRGGLGVHCEGVEQEWDVVVAHDLGCPNGRLAMVRDDS